LSIDHAGGCAGLDVDDRHRVGDGVVKVPCDAQPLLGQPAPGPLFPGLLEMPSPFLDRGDLLAAAAHHIAE
jgi:hypothetical protein